MFKGFDKDGEPVYDTLEAAIERAKQMREWDKLPDTVIMIHRKWIPLWFAHLVQYTRFEGLAYKKYEESK